MIFRRVTLLLTPLLVALMLTACATKQSDQQIVNDLWAAWEKSELLIQVDYPDAVPMVLVHGWNGSEFTWPLPERLIALEKRLQRDIFLFTYRTGIFANRYPPLEVLEEQLDRYLAPYESVDLVAHSMGGLLVRQYLSHHSDHHVRRVVFLATPHFGTNAAQVLVRLGSVIPEGNIQATEIQPGSDFLWQLNELAGAELEGVEVLNAYAAEQPLLKSDLVVPSSSAYLPWVKNIELEGNHHALAKHFDSYDSVIAFIQNGVVNQRSTAVASSDAWLRFKAGDRQLKVSESNFKSYNSRGIPNKDYRLCCKLRSGINSQPGNITVILESLEPGKTFAFMPYGGKEPYLIQSDDLLQLRKPVLMLEIDINAHQKTSDSKSDQEP